MKGLIYRTPKSPIGFEPCVQAVVINRGPEELLRYFLTLIDPIDRRYELCVQHRIYDMAADCVATLKDRHRASQLKNILIEQYGAEGSIKLRDKLDRISYK